MTTYKVRCEDDVQRHEGVFDNFADAQYWANWGHICTNRHTVVNVETGNESVLSHG